MIWRKAVLLENQPMERQQVTEEGKKFSYTARVVDLKSDAVLELNFFNVAGDLVLRHWLEEGGKSCVSYNVEAEKWTKTPLENQEALKSNRWTWCTFGNIERNPDADEVINGFIAFDESYKASVVEKISWTESCKARLKKWAAEVKQNEIAGDLISQIQSSDILADDAVKKAASRKIDQKRGARGWMAVWKYREGKAWKIRGKCTICNSEMDLPCKDVRYCANCLEPVESIYATPAGKDSVFSTSVLQFKRAANGSLIAVYYSCRQACAITGAGKNRTVDVKEDQAAIFVSIFDKKAVREYSVCGRWTHLGSAIDRYPDIVIRPSYKLFAGTDLENSHVWDYIAHTQYAKPIGYCRRYLAYPSIETLTNAKLWKIVENVITDIKGTRKAVNLKAKSPAKILGLTRPEVARCAEEGWGTGRLLAYRWLKENNLATEKEDIAELAELRNYALYIDLAQESDGEVQFYKYLKKQKVKSQGKSLGALASLYRDYLRFARKLEYDLEDVKNRYPSNLEIMHDRLSDQIITLQNAPKDKRIKAVADRLEKYSWEQDGFLIRPARTAQELINEGKDLMHCVGTYVDRYADGKTALFFIRRITEPNTPFYTLELREEGMTVVQNHGYRNSLQSPEVKAFEEKWLKWAKKQKAKAKAGQKEKKQTPAA